MRTSSVYLRYSPETLGFIDFAVSFIIQVVRELLQLVRVSSPTCEMCT
jgi:hypothetical protein